MKITLITALLVVASNGHARFQCPMPRIAETDAINGGLKVGSCGGNPMGAVLTTLAPGPNILHIEERVSHVGAPMRIALSTKGDDNFESCILLNHIPHHDTPKRGFYSITVDIPNINCTKCTLQMVQVMTDLLKTGPSCEYDPADTAGVATTNKCFSNYFSCADIAITGTQTAATFVCPAQPVAWPGSALPSNTYNKGAGSVTAWEINPITGVRTLASPFVNSLAKFTAMTGTCSSVSAMAAANNKLIPDPPVVVVATKSPTSSASTVETSAIIILLMIVTFSSV